VKSEIIGAPAECTVCTNGYLAYMTMDDGDTLFLECQECMTGYLAIDASGDTFRCEELPVQYRSATQAEVDQATAG
jgi:hypothetical protein